MTQALVSSGLWEFLLTNGTELIARNSRAAELPQASAHLPHGVLTGIPRPVAFAEEPIVGLWQVTAKFGDQVLRYFRAGWTSDGLEFEENAAPNPAGGILAGRICY